MRLAALFLANLLLAFPAHAKVIDGNALNDLFANCIKGKVELTPAVAETIGNCKFTYGYVTGVVDHGIGSKTITACLPEGVDFPEIGLAVRSWLLKHPERLNERAPLLIREVVQEAWPCAD